MGDRAEAYFYIDNTDDVDYDQACSSFQHSVQFANQAKPELGEPGVPCGLNGIYVGMKPLGVLSGGRFKIEPLVFFPDRNVLRHLPEQGLKNFDFGREIKESRAHCGRCRTIGNPVRITWSDDTRAVGGRDGANLNFEGLPYVAAENSNGLQLNAMYRTGWAPAGPRIRFTSDGRFVENGILDSIGYHGAEKSPGGGTYNIEQNTLELHYSTGHYVALSFYVFANDTGPRPKLIHLNSKDFVITE